MATKTQTIDGLEIDELMTLRDQVDDRIKTLAKARRDKLLAEMEALEPFLKSAKPSSRKGSKVAAKYRDPRTSKTWSGRGRPPVWILEYENNGGAREDLLI